MFSVIMQVIKKVWLWISLAITVTAGMFLKKSGQRIETTIDKNREEDKTRSRDVSDDIKEYKTAKKTIMK